VGVGEEMIFKAKFLASNPLSMAFDKANARYKGLTPYEISHGHCYEWALEVAKYLPEVEVKDVDLWPHRGTKGLPYHVWVEFQGKAYDAETLQGVHNWRDLPFFKKHQPNKLRSRRFPLKTALSGLKAKLNAFRPQLAAIAQQQYDEWDASGEYGDNEVGFGGICHLIADAWADLLSEQGYNTTTWSHSDEVHVSLMVWENTQEERDEEEIEVVDVDLNPYIYEKGGGYNWTKIPDVTIDPSDITFYRQFMSQENLEALQEGY
jgi:hypothetical protein